MENKGRSIHQRVFWIAVLALFALLWSGCETFGPPGAGPFTTVIVDAGHGGHDRGARPVSGRYEKDVALDTALRLAKILRARGFKVILSRNGDYFVTLGKRVQISNATRNAIFVSIHYNWHRGRSGHGIETYFYSARSQRLAANVQKELLGTYRTRNRGIKRRGFYVLRKNARPAILVECGFLSNPSDNEVAQNERGRQRIADAIADGISAERRGRNPLR